MDLVLPPLVVAGLPLIVVVLLLVEEIKAYGLEGKLLRGVSMLIGFLMALAVSLGNAMPVDASGWITVIVVGLLYGIAASGGYDFINKRWPPKA